MLATSMVVGSAARGAGLRTVSVVVPAAGRSTGRVSRGTPLRWSAAQVLHAHHTLARGRLTAATRPTWAAPGSWRMLTNVLKSSGQRAGGPRRVARSGRVASRRRMSSRAAEEAEEEYTGFLGMENSHVVYGIMAANVIGFLAWHATDDLTWMRRNFTLSSQHLAEGRIHTLLTSAFSHNELNRLMAGTAGIFLVAAPAISILGQARFAALYAAGGIISAFAGLMIASKSEKAQQARPMTWRFGSNGAVLTVAAFTACMLPSIPLGPKMCLLPVVAAQGLVFKLVGCHSEGDWGHLAGIAVGVAAFFLTRRFHPVWKQAVHKYHTV